jgi:CRP/FNR family transcriptional regulator
LAASEPVNDEALRAKAEVGASVDREVALLRDALVHNSEPPPSERIAALFVTLSRCNGYEGRAADIITDSLKCGVVAGYLNMSLDVLAGELAELESQGLIESAASGLRLKDLPALEKLADGIS